MVYFVFQERGVLGHGTNRKWSLPIVSQLPEQVQTIVQNSGLAPLVRASYEQIDRKLLTAFAERWYSDTNTFHLPVGELTVTLDDVSCLLHVPVSGKIIQWKKPNAFDGAVLMGDNLGMSLEDAQEETRKNRGGAIRFQTLHQLYYSHVENRRYVEAARCYLLALVGSTLFIDKSMTYVGMQYVLPLVNLNRVHRFAWGACALAHLYDELSEVSKSKVKQLGGYMTLLQVIFISEPFLI